jgi:hypothetical protein
VAALQAVILVARLSETEGSSNAVGGLEIAAAIVIPPPAPAWAPTVACSESTKRIWSEAAALPLSVCPNSTREA